MSDILEQAGRAYDITGHELPTDHMWIRRLDPRVRIVALSAYAITLVQLTSIPLLLAALVLSFALMSQARLPVGPTIKRVAMMDSFIIFMLVMLPFTMAGTPLFHVFGFAASYEGVMKGIDILLKANAIVMATLALLSTLEPVTLGHALARLKVPAPLVHLLLFTVRYIEVLHEEYNRLRTAMKCRGFQPANRWHSYKSFGYLVGMLLIRSFERSERIMQAMKCRGFNGQFHLLDRMAFDRLDAVFVGFASLTMLTLLALEILNVLPS
ncbi:cobalt ECF transporter T component CbiQ [Cohaesibacter gelatinilyticus]|uniref:Cobalt/nickel transport system permease protein n=1 Tax=Cohaesibacter gelatinilyticus TaxID=372072 RepID=A0A285NII6_9HYPH|nr:cobalt ECF transporter T component CbiQ [Cohaesibacter gelatinilyticus]SNZ07471.1 cobalt/nickel transport system permease protein [Cohaesibacter gelatinilyticus]